MLAVIWQDLRAEMENSILLFENVGQMAQHIVEEHSLTEADNTQVQNDGFAIICPDDEDKDKLIKEDDAIHKEMEYPRGSVSYTSVSCIDLREWEVT